MANFTVDEDTQPMDEIVKPSLRLLRSNIEYPPIEAENFSLDPVLL